MRKKMCAKLPKVYVIVVMGSITRYYNIKLIN